MKRSKHNLSSTRLTTLSMGYLTPLGTPLEVLPGDTIQLATSALIRVAPLLAPVMHPVQVRIHHWFVPNRLVWDDWEDFITGGPDGMDASVFPTIKFTSIAAADLANQYGLPVGTYANPNELEVSALPFRGYGLIFNEWYRDQDLVSERVVDTGSGPDTTTNTNIDGVAWGKDYFTTARPWAQKGPDITVPVGASAPVIRDTTSTASSLIRNAATGTLFGNTPLEADASGRLTNDDGTNIGMLDPNGNLKADLGNISDPALINELRTAFALQRYEEARARYGSRYTEYLRYLGVRSSDARLQRPEYLGGGKQTIQFSEVLQTSPTTDGDDTEGVGNIKGHGIGALRSNRFRRFFEEHGYVHSFMSVMPKNIYADGVHRTFNRRTKEDFFQRELQHIGQQEVLAKETYVNGRTVAQMNATWGYVDRYSEYKHGISSVGGIFATTLDYWHQARLFASPPTLNGGFVQSAPTDRIYAASSGGDQLWCMINHNVQARRIVDAAAGGFAF